MQQHLSSDRQLEGGRALGHILKESTLNLFLTTSMQIFVSCKGFHTDKTITLKVDPTDSIEKVKQN